MQVAEVLRIACPQLAVVHEQVVVVSELVAFAHQCVWMVEVILHLVCRCGIRTDGVCIVVVEGSGSEHILHRLIVHALVRGSDDTDVPALVLVNLLVERRRECDVQRIVVLRLYVVHGILSLRRSLLVAVV